MDHQPCPNCGKLMQRETKPMTLRYQESLATFAMPGWYCDGCREGVHTSEDMQESDRPLHLLKAQAENALLPDDYLEQRARRGNRTKFEQAVAKVPTASPDVNDAL